QHLGDVQHQGRAAGSAQADGARQRADPSCDRGGGGRAGRRGLVRVGKAPVRRLERMRWLLASRRRVVLAASVALAALDGARSVYARIAYAHALTVWDADEYAHIAWPPGVDAPAGASLARACSPGAARSATGRRAAGTGLPPPRCRRGRGTSPWANSTTSRRRRASLPRTRICCAPCATACGPARCRTSVTCSATPSCGR